MGEVDAGAYEAMRDLVGAPRAGELLNLLADEIRRRLSAERLRDSAPDELGRDAHALVSSAGVLGFTDLARRCSELEMACLTGTVPSATLAATVASADAALAGIDRLRVAA